MTYIDEWLGMLIQHNLEGFPRQEHLLFLVVPSVHARPRQSSIAASGWKDMQLSGYLGCRALNIGDFL
jgi:hypothetical protein